jgi:hypothetical protein
MGPDRRASTRTVVPVAGALLKIRFFDRQDASNPLNGETFDRPEPLLDVLKRFANRKPFFCELVGQNGFNLLVGVGTLGCAQYSPGDGSLPYLMAVAPDTSPRQEVVEFFTGGTPSPVPGRYALPFSLVAEIVVCFQETGGLSKSVSWEEI